MNIIKHYSNGEVTIKWEPTKCIHSGNCVKGLPEVFRPREKPWIQPDSASSDDIIATVNRCPSGALTMVNNNIVNMEQPTAEKTQVEVLANGPLKVSGEITVHLPDGKEEVKTKNTFLCRCGASTNKPYCDGTHKKIGFEGWLISKSRDRNVTTFFVPYFAHTTSKFFEKMKG